MGIRSKVERLEDRIGGGDDGFCHCSPRPWRCQIESIFSGELLPADVEPCERCGREVGAALTGALARRQAAQLVTGLKAERSRLEATLPGLEAAVVEADETQAKLDKAAAELRGAVASLPARNGWQRIDFERSDALTAALNRATEAAASHVGHGPATRGKVTRLVEAIAELDRKAETLRDFTRASSTMKRWASWPTC